MEMHPIVLELGDQALADRIVGVVRARPTTASQLDWLGATIDVEGDAIKLCTPSEEDATQRREEFLRSAQPGDATR